MKKFIFSFFCFILLQKPTYNPFDNQFKIEESYFKKDKLDTIWDTCGYYALVKKEKRYTVEYIYLSDDFLAKGFSFNLDTLKLNSKYSLKKRDSISSISFNPENLNIALKKFNYKFHKQIRNHVLLINLKNNQIDTSVIYSNSTDYINFYRKLSYYNEKP
ncbi:hypothetical protein [Tenacibaculum sp. Bg11-29]|uniref:hypothetical protein n=1 Tax=Tenacibaculum sp. Bg11-29 TaxID=2058306 RepID=UPI0012FE8707|nr:hypothetical protein [Tenacibaculum sp. Bg11-29]